MPETFADGNTSLGVYEHSNRSIEIDGIPYGGWIESTGGGTAAEGQKHIVGAGGIIRGLTDGIEMPQEITMKWEHGSWELIKSQLRTKATVLGIRGQNPHRKVEFTIVDQYMGADVLTPSKTTRTTVKIKSEKPNTPSDGTAFDAEVVVIPVKLPEVSYGL